MKQEARAVEREEARKSREVERQSTQNNMQVNKVVQRRESKIAAGRKKKGWATGNQNEILSTLRSKIDENRPKKKEGINTLVSRLDKMRDELRSGAGGRKAL